MTREIPRMLSYLALSLFLACVVLNIGCSRDSEASQGLEHPAGVVEGAQIEIGYLYGATRMRFEILEVRGNWARAKAVNYELWEPGTVVWINLAAVEQIRLLGT